MRILKELGIPVPLTQEEMLPDLGLATFPEIYNEIFGQLDSIINSSQMLFRSDITQDSVLKLAVSFKEFDKRFRETLSNLVFFLISGMYRAKDGYSNAFWKARRNSLLKLLRDYFPQFINYNDSLSEEQGETVDPVFSTTDLSIGDHIELIKGLFVILRNFYNINVFDDFEEILTQFAKTYLTDGEIDLCKIFMLTPTDNDPLRLQLLAELWIAIVTLHPNLREYNFYVGVEGIKEYLQYALDYIKNIVDNDNISEGDKKNGEQIIRLLEIILKLPENSFFYSASAN